MIEIIKETERVEAVDYSREFVYKNDKQAGFAFSCDKKGNVIYENDSIKNTYNRCLNDTNLIDKGIITYSHRYTEPAIGKCCCGEHIQLTGDVQCNKCGQWYNIFGQELLPPDQWEENSYYED